MTVTVSVQYFYILRGVCWNDTDWYRFSLKKYGYTHNIVACLLYSVRETEHRISPSIVAVIRERRRGRHFREWDSANFGLILTVSSFIISWSRANCWRMDTFGNLILVKEPAIALGSNSNERSVVVVWWLFILLALASPSASEALVIRQLADITRWLYMVSLITRSYNVPVLLLSHA